RVAIPKEAMPVNRDGVPLDLAPWNEWDGFSPMTSMLTVLPGPIDASALVPWHRVEESLLDTSPTVLVDVQSGERVAHFAELEASPESDPAHPTLYLRPARRLAEGRVYAVGIRRRMSPGGAPLPPSPVFCALRDSVPTTSPEIEARRPTFESEVMEPLAKA